MEVHLVRGQELTYLSWEVVFHKSYSATGKDDIAKDDKTIKELEMIGQSIK